MHGRATAVGLAIGLSVLPQAASAATEIDQCAFVTVSGHGVVTADLDCSADPVGIGVVASGTLDLQGHTLSGVDIGCSLVNGSGSCKIKGPGTLTGSIDAGEGATVSDLTILAGHVSGRRLTLEDTTILGEDPGGDCAVELSQAFSVSKLKMIDTTIDGALCGIDADGAVKMKRCVVTGCSAYGVDSSAQGFGSERVRVTDSEITSNGGFGLRGTSVRVVGSTVSGNGGIGIHARSGLGARIPRLTIKKSSVDDNDEGAALTDTNGFGTKGVKVGNTSISNNAHFGLAAGLTTGGKMRINASTLTGNGYAAECGVTEPCADIGSGRMPDLRKTTCGSSYDFGSGLPGASWGVCSLD